MRYRFFTYNIDWAKSNGNETESLKSIKDEADVIFVQEAKHLQVKAALGRAFFVHQNTRNQAKQGVAIAWSPRLTIRRWKPAPGKSENPSRGRGYVLGVSNRGLRLLPRYINFRVLILNGHTVCLISTHRPPQRFRWLWTAFDKALIRFVKHMPFPVIVGMDSNEHTHKLFAEESGMVWHGVGIDGFWVSKRIEPLVVKGSLKAHPKSHSDHHPVSLEFDFPNAT